MGMIWRGLIHDLDKLKPKQWLAYSRFFHEKSGTKKTILHKTGYYKPFDTGDIDFDLAVKYHSQRNSHHWQFWCFPKDKEGLRIFEMSDNDVKEMVCDWIGAGHAQGVGNWQNPTPWWEENKNKMQLSFLTIIKIEDMLKALKFRILIKALKRLKGDKK